MTFIKHTAIKARSVNKISITLANTFNFPRKFYQDNNLGHYKYVVIYYDKDKSLIGLHFINDEDEKYKLKMQKSKKGYGAFISATSFFKTNNIDLKKYKGRYDWKIEDTENIGKLFIINLEDRLEKDHNSDNMSSS